MKKDDGVRFSIVSPSLRQLKWLQLAARSVADQRVECEHLVQDGGGDAGIEAVVAPFERIRLKVEPDTGMYDALNKGFARATGDIWAWLNCDEQYLPGALEAVASRFEEEPELDVLLANNLIVDSSGQYLAHRFSLNPTLSQMWVRFPVSSCALFFRPRIWRPFDSQWKSAADWWWFRDMLMRGARVGLLRQFVAAFTETKANLGLAEVTAIEQGQILASRPWWAHVGKPLLLAVHRWRMRRSGAFGVRPFQYALHTTDSTRRVEFRADRPTARWIRPTDKVD